MKKNLLLLTLLLSLAFFSCKKESQPVAGTPVLKGPVTTPNTHFTATSAYYNDLVLQPRQPGENFDTYMGIWNGSTIKMIGSPVWNHDLYPNLVNGVPAYNASYIPTGQDQIRVENTGNQDIFTLSIATIAETNFSEFLSDVSKFRNAYNTYIDYTSVGVTANIPKAEDYIKASYTGGQAGATYVAVTGKLIRVTTGSHWALASVDYPIPPATPPQQQFITFTKDGYEITVRAINGNIIGVEHVMLNVPPYTAYSTSGAEGTYTTVDSNYCNLSNVVIHLSTGATITYTGDGIFGF